MAGGCVHALPGSRAHIFLRLFFLAHLPGFNQVNAFSVNKGYNECLREFIQNLAALLQNFAILCTLAVGVFYESVFFVIVCVGQSFELLTACAQTSVDCKNLYLVNRLSIRVDFFFAESFVEPWGVWASLAVDESLARLSLLTLGDGVSVVLSE